jgi:hypothetical protein
MVAHSVKMIDWDQLAGPTSIQFQSTSLLPGGHGEAQVEPGKGIVRIRAAFSGLPPASRLGAQYLTYVLWSITPAGRPSNLGEVFETDGTNKVIAKSTLPVFGLLVTAEPYFAVTQPSDAVVLEAAPPEAAVTDTPPATCELLHRIAPTAPNAETVPAPTGDPEAPLALRQAQRAIEIARAAGAERYAPETFKVANQLLHQAADQQAKNAPMKDVAETAQEAVMLAEDARALAVRRQENASQP